MKRTLITTGLALALFMPRLAEAQVPVPRPTPMTPPPEGIPTHPLNPLMLGSSPSSVFAPNTPQLRLMQDRLNGSNTVLGSFPFNSFSALGTFPLSAFPTGLGVGGGFPWFGGGSGYGSGAGGSGANYSGLGPGMYMSGLGEFVKQNAEAAVLYENAREHAIKNGKLGNLTYFDLRDANDAYRQKQRDKYKHSNETLARSAMEELPPRLGPDDLDPYTGRVNWPAALKADQFAGFRSQVEQLFAARSSSTQPSDVTAQIQEVAREMGNVLRSDIEKIPADDYMTARKFLDSLNLATRHLP